MKMWIATAALAAMTVAPLRGDVMLVQTMTIEGAAAAMLGNAQLPRMTMRIKGQKSRADIEVGGQTIIAITDLAAKQVILLNSATKTATVSTPDTVMPAGMPILLDEAYHHYVDDPRYATGMPYVTQGRPVIVARTFSKIVGLAGMRLGYAIAPKPLIDRMRPHSIASINALVKHGGAAALKDEASQAEVKRLNAQLRNKAVADLTALGYECIPSECNFFMVHIKRQIQPTIEDFRKRGVLVGRPFPPMLEHMRVSVGTADEMNRFMAAFKEVFAGARSTSAQ